MCALSLQPRVGSPVQGLNSLSPSLATDRTMHTREANLPLSRMKHRTACAARQDRSARGPFWSYQKHQSFGYSSGSSTVNWHQQPIPGPSPSPLALSRLVIVRYCCIAVWPIQPIPSPGLPWFSGRCTFTRHPAHVSQGKRPTTSISFSASLVDGVGRLL